MTDDAPIHGADPRLERLMFFSDAVFAIAITLLIIEVHAPELPSSATDPQWWQALAHLAPSLAGFCISFLVIGAIWAAHHRVFALLAHFDPRLVWPNLLLLMSVAVLPFPTALIAAGSLAHAPFIVYGIALLLVSLVKAWLTGRAMRPALLAHPVTQARRRLELRRRWMMPLAAAISLGLAFVVPGWNNMGMLLVPLMAWLPWFRLKLQAYPSP